MKILKLSENIFTQTEEQRVLTVVASSHVDCQSFIVTQDTPHDSIVSHFCLDIEDLKALGKTIKISPQIITAFDI